MRLLTFAIDGRTLLGVEVDGQVVDLAAAYATIPTRAKEGPATLPSDMLCFLWGGESAMAAARQVVALVEAAHQRGDRARGAAGEIIEYPLAAGRVLAPISRPAKIICLGLNYADHAAETGHEKPKLPILFTKFANAISGPGAPIVLTKASEKIDYEAEFAFVIGKTAKHVAEADALDYVAGYMMLNDVSARDLQTETSQWFRGKSPDTFAPTGPYLVTRDEVSDPHALDVKLWLNGQMMQSSNTRHLIFNVPFLVHHLSKTLTLEPGDIVSTGTPSGVGMAREPQVFLKAGDVVRIEIGNLGVLENPVVAE